MTGPTGTVLIGVGEKLESKGLSGFTGNYLRGR